MDQMDSCEAMVGRGPANVVRFSNHGIDARGVLSS